MLLTLNTDSVKELNLNYESYSILLLMAENKIDLIIDYLDTIYKLDNSEEIYKRYIKIFQKEGLLENSDKCELTEKAKNLVTICFMNSSLNSHKKLLEQMELLIF